MCNFQVGQRVTPITDSKDWTFGISRVPPGPEIILPLLGMVYTIRGIHYYSRYDIFGITLVEIRNPVNHVAGFLAQEPDFCSKNFRPVRETSIECFEKLLAPIPPVKILTPETL